METKFKVITKKTGKSIKELVLFVYRARYPRVTGHFLIFGIICILISFVAKKDRFDQELLWVLRGLGILSVLMAFFRHYIAMLRTMHEDQSYQESWELGYWFMQKDIYGYVNGKRERDLGQYSDVTRFYEDERNFYIEISGNDLHLLPKRDFVVGNAEGFRTFIQQRSQVECIWMPTQWNNRFRRWRIDWKESGEQQQKMLDDYREMREEKKREKRNKRK